jgi:tetratricopeptide (TPR) repeat protein
VGGTSESLQDLIRRHQSERFVGRDGQLAQFTANLAIPPGDPRRRFVFSIHGDGGVGKTFLVRQLQRVAAEHGAAAGYVDEQLFGVPEAMARIAAQLSGRDQAMKGFTKLYENYRQRRGEVEADPQAPAGIASLMTHTAVRVGVESLRTVPGVGGLAAAVDADALADQADRLRSFLGAKFRDHEAVRMLLSPVEVLTPTFVRELAAVGSRRPVALFLDTYERTGVFLGDWLLAVLEGRYGDLPADMVITIAGRAPLDTSAWSPYLGVLVDVPLAPFSEVEARQLLAGRGIADERVVEVILTLSGRLPLLMAMLAEHRPDDPEAVGDPSGDAVERFLKWESDPVRRALAVSAALPRVVNEDVLRALVEDEPDPRTLFTWLRSLSFVSHQAGRCQYHAVVRSAMLRLERGQSPTRWAERHQRLADLYRGWRTALSPSDAWGDAGWRANRLEETYHLLCAQAPGALDEALRAVLRVCGRRLAVAPWGQAIAQAEEDAGSAATRGWGRRLAQALLNPDSSVIAVVELLLTSADLDGSERAEAVRIRGRERREGGEYELALADFSRALELDSGNEEAWAGRGQTYLLMGRNDDALTDLTHALELDPADDWAIARRGETYRRMGRYDEALTDFARAIELNPTYGWAIALRGETYQQMGRYEDALADFARAIELNPANGWVIGSRGQTYWRMGRYEDALTDFARAIELNPTYGWAVALRGETYRLMDRYEDALADFARAIELNPAHAWAIGSRGQTYRRMGRYEDALADLSCAIELNPDSDWAIADRGETYRLMGRFDDALTDFTRALELDPVYSWVISHRGQTYRQMGRYDDALADLTRALELDSDSGWKHYSIALVWLCLAEQAKSAVHLEHAAVLFERATTTRNHGNLVVCRVVQRDFPEARRLASTFVDSHPTRYQIRELMDDLSELAEVPGIDQTVVRELLALATRALPEP